MNFYSRYIVEFIIIAAGIIAGCYNYSKGYRYQGITIIILAFTLLAELSSFVAAIVWHNSIPVHHVASPFWILLWAIFFYRYMQGEFLKKIMLVSAVLLILTSIVNSLFIESINDYPNIPYKAATIFRLIWSAVILVQLLDMPTNINLFKDPLFLIVLGGVWFNTISSLYFFFSSFMMKYKVYPPLVPNIHLVSNYLYYSILFYAMLCLKNYANARKFSE
ncbi:MAG: hypothetical protein QM687_04425 [Ferruginibacter sp.]